jgi:peptidoglycan hydrolase-like protein with peptidoglycan-binding domain
MKQRQLFSILILSGVSVVWSVGSAAWSQTTQGPGKGQTQTKDGKGEKSGAEKMEARDAQEPAQTERKKGETEMEARGAQKPGRMEKSGAESTGAKENQGEKSAPYDIKKAQEALKNKGHDPGSMDGVMGQQTRQAIRAFQKDNGLKESGTLDAETAEKLGIEKGTASGASSKRSGGMGKQASPMQNEPSSPARK